MAEITEEGPVITLHELERILYQETSVIDHRDVPLLMYVVTKAAAVEEQDRRIAKMAAMEPNWKRSMRKVIEDLQLHPFNHQASQQLDDVEEPYLRLLTPSDNPRDDSPNDRKWAIWLKEGEPCGSEWMYFLSDAQAAALSETAADMIKQKEQRDGSD